MSVYTPLHYAPESSFAASLPSVRVCVCACVRVRVRLVAVWRPGLGVAAWLAALLVRY